MESPSALAWLALGHCVAQDGHCGLAGYPGHPGFHGHPRDVPPDGLGCGVSREGLSGGSPTIRELCRQHEGWPGIRGARGRCPEGVPGRTRQDSGAGRAWGCSRKEGHAGRGGTSRVRQEGVVGQGPSIPLHGNPAGRGDRASIPPGEGPRGRDGQRDVPLHPCLSWEAAAQLHLVVCPLMAVVALQPPRCHLVCDGGPPIWGPGPNPSTNPCAWGELLILLLPQKRFKQSQCCRAFAKRKNAGMWLKFLQFWGLCSRQTWQGWRCLWDRPPCSVAPRIPGILLAACPKLRAWRGASLALPPRAEQGLSVKKDRENFSRGETRLHGPGGSRLP